MKWRCLASPKSWRHLYFLVPEALQQRRIHSAIEHFGPGRANREREPAEIVNNFSTVRHASVFEGVKAETLHGKRDSENYQRADSF